MIGEGVMGPPGQIGGNPVSQCGPSSPQRSTDHDKRALDKLPRPGQAEAEQCLALQRPVQKGVDILRRMHAKNIFEGYRPRLNDFLRREDAPGSVAVPGPGDTCSWDRSDFPWVRCSEQR